ncbi:alpha/beta fold hydrolase [Mycolicibacterium helvum]|uniref:Alpha/beta hydrolase n=1 Tax=Mycolicibacterium helvum TaxID=1534349 RepID=A0A7I7T944_9MYCO|nr:alpha/beta hydrolase [Mycolicibacterium helvum]BBY64979.1 alpha/beta hydrolase [Mycolicibacterium helvum]
MTPSLTSFRIQGPVGELAATRSVVAGTEPTIVLLHPVNTASLVWHPVMRMSGLSMVALDLRGHGDSGYSGPYTVEDGYVLDVLALLDGLSLDAVHLVGGSLGGTIALAMAAIYPQRVRSVTTLGSTLGTGVSEAAIADMTAAMHGAGTRRYFEELVPQIVGPRYRGAPDLAETARVAATRPAAVIEAIMREAFSADIRHLAGQVQAPVLAVGGCVDPTCAPEMSIEIASRTGGSYVLLDDVGHLPMLEVPNRIAELIAAHSGSAQTEVRT